jgi:hypothetical protein
MIYLYFLVGLIIAYFGRSELRSIIGFLFLVSFWPIFITIAIYRVFKNETAN